MSVPLTPSYEDTPVSWDMVTGHGERSTHGGFDSCINYQIKVGNFDSTLCLQDREESLTDSFELRAESGRGSGSWMSLPGSDEELTLIQCDGVDDIEEEEETIEAESQHQVNMLREHLNIMRDLSFSDGAKTRSPSIESTAKTNLSYEMMSDGESDCSISEESESETLSDSFIKPNVLTIPSSYDPEFKFECCEKSSTDNQPTDKSEIGLSTPPTTPTLNSAGATASGQKFIKRRTELLLVKHITTPKSIQITTSRGPNIYEVNIKMSPDTLKHLAASAMNVHLKSSKISKELVPLEEMKKNPAYKLNNPGQNKESNNIKFNLDYVKTLSKSKKDRYYSRLNIFELSKILNLDDYDISLTKEVEINILEIFKEYCNFRLGYQTWIRDTTKEHRRRAIELLHRYTSIVYPEFDKFKLEVIIRRGSYSLMQSRLRRDRRNGKSFP